MMKVSVILPSRNEMFLQRTIDDIFEKASGGIEVIAVLDDYWPDPPLKDHPGQIIIHKSREGMRSAIQAGADVARGKFIMKLDAHCCLDEGFDEKLVQDCEPDWIVVPRRYSLDPDRWERYAEKWPYPVDAMYLDAPTENSIGYHGKVWSERAKERKDVLIDDEMTFQGSCWFCHREYFQSFGGFDLGYGSFFREAQELGFRTWLSGGKVVRNKKTWYAHLHKGSRFRRGYTMNVMRRTREAVVHMYDLWIRNSKGPKQIYDLQWLFDKFAPVPEWNGHKVADDADVDVLEKLKVCDRG